jgi:putative FmdB family regulatory protein
MPLYEYLCKKCKHRFEKIQQFSDKPVKKCPECGGPVEKLISQSSVQFKGSGWYVSDYGKKGSSGTSSSSSAESDSASAAKETKDSKDSKDSKPEKKEEKAKPDTSSKKSKKD